MPWHQLWSHRTLESSSRYLSQVECKGTKMASYIGNKFGEADVNKLVRLTRTNRGCVIWDAL